MERVTLAIGAATDVGKVREVNQDAFFATPPLFVVADGMGGHHGGDVASRIAVEEFERADAAALSSPTSLVGARLITLVLESAQARIAEYSTQQGAVGDWYAGTTVVAGMLVHEEDRAAWLVANLGDSRAYCFADGRLEQISVDHSLVQELMAAGRLTPERAASHPQRNIVTRALGGPDAPDPDFFRLPIAGDTRLLLCSDGISGMIDDVAIARVLAEVPDAQAAAQQLVADALAAGGVDNATAVVVDALPASPQSS